MPITPGAASGIETVVTNSATDLFAAQSTESHEPLAARMRPRTLDEYIGQDHIVGKGRLLRRAIAADQLTSVIFYGPPGSGKTTLARVIANHTSSHFLTLNAVLTGVADIRNAIADAETQRTLYGKKTILFVDEVHRWNKSQQDALLPWVENGTIILIGATTENPFFEVNKALVSRSRVFQLKTLTQADLRNVARQAISDGERGYGHWQVQFEDGALEHLVETANGDARSLLNALQLAVETTPERWAPHAVPPCPAWGSTIYISRETAEESIQKKVVLYDRDGDYHYDIISAFIKSLRGRDPDAAMYWLARMVKAGEDPHFIFRRMLISSCEDTGLAAPEAISIVSSCAQAFDRVGMPEGRYFLAHAALYLATAPKSNSSMAFFDALSAVEKEDAEVPNHLRDSSRDAEGFGHGAGYLYPHAYRDHWVAQQYLPDALVGKVFYTPTTQGYEAKIREDVLSRREVQIASLVESDTAPLMENPISEWWLTEHFHSGTVKKDENVTFSPENKKKNAVLDKAERMWRSRLDSNKAETLSFIRDTMLSVAPILRHHRAFIYNADDALLIFETLRKTPEGLTCGACSTPSGLELLTQYARTLGDLEKPQLCIASKKPFFAGGFLETLSSFGDIVFDRIFLRNIFTSLSDIQHFVSILKCAFYGSKNQERDIAFGESDSLHKDTAPVFSPQCAVVISQRIPSSAQRLSALLPQENHEEMLLAMHKAEDEFFSSAQNPLFNWNQNDIEHILASSGFVVHVHTVPLTEKRRVSEAEIDRWFSKKSVYGDMLYKSIGDTGVEEIAALFKSLAPKTLFSWKTNVAFAKVSRE